MPDIRGLRYTDRPSAVVLMNDKDGYLGKGFMHLGMSVYSHHPKNEEALYSYHAKGKLIVLGGSIEQFLDIVAARETSITNLAIKKGRTVTPELLDKINAHPARKIAPHNVVVI